MLTRFFRSFIFIGLMMFYSCESSTPHTEKKDPVDRYVDEVVDKYLSDVSNKYGFYCEAVTWGMYGGIVRLIGPRFTTEEKIDIPKARKLFLELATDFLKRVNDSEELRPYLVHYPFTIENIEIAISYRGQERPQEDEIKYGFLGKGTIYYKNIDPSTGRYKLVHKESYEEIVQNSDLNSLVIKKL